MRSIRCSLLFLGAALLAACGGGGGGLAAVEVRNLAFRVQPSATEAGAPIPVEVAVVDETGSVVGTASVEVTVEIATGTAPLGGTTVRDAAGGIAAFDDLSIDVAAGGYTLRASATGFAAVVSDPFGIVPGPPAALEFRSQPANTAALDPLPAFEVEILDVFGNFVDSATDVVTVEFEVNAGAAHEALLHASGFGTFDLLGNGSVDAPFEHIETAGPAVLPPLPALPNAEILALARDPLTGEIFGTEASFLTGDFVSIDPVTGATTVVGTGTLTTDITGLAFDATGNLLLGVVRGSLLEGPDLYAIETATGVATRLGAIAPTGAIAADTLLGFTGLSRDPVTGTLYAAARLASAGPRERALVVLDPIARTADLVGVMNDLVSALAFTQDGTLYAATDTEFAEGVAPLRPETLFVVDTSDGSMTPVQPLGNGTPGEALVAFPAPGVLSGGTVVPAALGVATFDDLVVDASAPGYRLRAKAPGLAGATSAPFDVLRPDDLATVTFAAPTQAVDESAGTVTVEIRLNRAVRHEVVVGIDTFGIALGTSTAEGGGVDHDLNEGHVVVRIPAGTTSATLSFSVVDDAVPEADEDLVLEIAGVALASRGTAATHTVTILDDD